MGSVFDPSGIMIYIQLDNKFDWFGFIYDLVYPILVIACGRMGQDKILKPMKEMMRGVLERVSVASGKI